MKHFITKKENTNLELIGILLTIVFVGLPAIFFYELIFCRGYWVNRVRLYRMFRKNKGELVYLITKDIAGDKISMFSYTLDGEEYSIWLWHDKDLFTLSDSYLTSSSSSWINGNYTDYIGLFLTDLSVLRIGHKKVINKLKSKINEN